MNTPFAVSPAAERHLRERLARRPPSEMELSLTRALRSHVRDKQGTLLTRCDHEHYFLGYDRPEKHTGFFRLGFGAAELAISPSTLETLRGKCLSIEHLPRLDDPVQTREILVAMPIDQTPSEV